MTLVIVRVQSSPGCCPGRISHQDHEPLRGHWQNVKERQKSFYLSAPKMTEKRERRSWFMSPLLPLFFPLPFIRGELCELAWLAEQLQMWDAIHIARFQSIKSSEFRTFIFFNYVNHMPQIFPIKSRGRAFFFSSQQIFNETPKRSRPRKQYFNCTLQRMWSGCFISDYQGLEVTNHPFSVSFEVVFVATFLELIYCT